ncbi:uncharacterized protein LOC129001588 [Macrosteles quadrilineatus]|uniref:uncharacterized protein LOC129001588 n=1 Tax=Macrosteles quadrilineatus TaxID=74068 RepID=UPI0023E3063A|nr:uncharacterized protein LOC129001588 [Macrosteles quadrilineatus]
MTKSQNEIFKKYCQDVVCVDGTHGVNSYNFQLYTLLVLDDTREGMPVGFMISNRQDEDVMKIFFNEIKKSTGEVKTRVFMSDMDNTFFNAWKKTMDISTKHLYCTWHVLRAWRKNVHSKVKGKVQKEIVYKQLQTLLCELDQTAFKKMLSKAVNEWLSKEETKEFAKYFNSYYLQEGEFQKWAYCQRIHFGINTNMALENFNKLLKYCYLRGKRVKRLDKTLCAILRLINDKLFDILIKSFKGKVVSKLKILRKRHAESLKLSPEIVFPQSCTEWQVLSSGTTEFYTVTKIKSNCDRCSLRCFHCNSCFHEYQCSCIDNGIKNNMCKHIHLVAKSVKSNPPASTKDWTADALELSLVQGLSKPKQDDNISEAKEAFIADLISTLRNGITNTNQLTAVKNHCKSIGPMLKSMEERSLQPPIVIEDRTPVNMNITKQRKFIFVKRQNTKKKPLQGTSQADRNELAFQLLKGSGDTKKVSHVNADQPSVHHSSTAPE